LYFNVGCANTYSKTFGGKCGYMVAVDLATQKMLWRSDDLTSTGPFVLTGGVLITGYGFTAEKDYVFALDAATGKTLQRILVDSTPEGMELTGSQLKAVSYGSILYEFRVN
jgi:outer membrane protein assembly factor BamB